MKSLIKLLVLLFILSLSVFSFAGEKEGIKYADRWTSELNPSTLCLPAEQYELLNMGQFLDEEGRLLIALLLQLPNSETKIVIVQYMDTQEAWLVTYEEGKKIYALDKKNNIYLEWDSEKRCFKQKAL